MANTCRRELFACALRVARLDSDGTLLEGANNLYVSDALTTLALTFNVEEGDEFVVKNACGELCVNVKNCDQLKRIDLTLSLCYPDPELLELMVDGSTLLTSGAAVGYAIPALGSATCPDGVSIELWAKRYDSGGALDGTFPYSHYVLPRTYWQHSARTFENGPVTAELTGFAVENDGWGLGPNAEWPADAQSDRALFSLPDADIPTTQCGYLELVS